MAAPGTANIRFRMQNGSDHGPKVFDCSLSVLAVKEKLVLEWPKDPEPSSPEGSVDTPKAAADLKLILSGQILDNAKTLTELKLGQNPDSVVTMHLVIRMPNGPTTKGEGAAQEADKRMSRCACVVA